MYWQHVDCSQWKNKKYKRETEKSFSRYPIIKCSEQPKNR
jgi:hypothetical protein